MAKEKTQSIDVLSDARPRLLSGHYKFKAAQTINGHSYDTDKEFVVDGPQFRLPAEKIFGVSPADGAAIEDRHLLPTISFSTKTLPWQRKAITVNNVDQPWLALLLVHDDELKDVVIKNKFKLSDLKPDAQCVSFSFDPEQSYGDTGADECTVVEFNAALFNKVVPLSNELALFTHIKKVKNEEQFMLLGDTQKTNNIISIVNTNRVAKVGVNHLFLVSLENMGQYLPTSTETRKQTSIASTNKSTIRLVCLHRRSYTLQDSGVDFEDIVENLAKQKHTALCYPPNAAKDDQQKAVNRALSIGYTPLPHRLRNGAQTLSWYRGPLAPYKVDLLNYDFLVYHADSLEMLNPALQMLDQSYAAAWQLGRLLAMKDKGFTHELMRWKEEHEDLQYQQDIRAENLQQLGLEASESEDHLSLEIDISELVFNQLIRPALTNSKNNKQ